MRFYRFTFLLCKILLQRTLSRVTYQDFSNPMGVALLTGVSVLLLKAVANATHWLLTGATLDDSHRAAVVIISTLVIYPVSIYHFFCFEYTKPEAALAVRITTPHALLLLGAVACFLCIVHRLNL